MKTLVLSLPRMGSKQITFNLYRYLKARYGNISEIYPIVDIEPSLDEYFNIWHHRFKFTLARNENNLIRTNIPIKIAAEEIEHRVNILKELEGPYVIKYFPVDKKITELLIKEVDHIYTLWREDIFGAALSTCISEISASWINSPYQKNIIVRFLDTPIEVPEDRFSDIIRQIMWYNKTYCTNATYKIRFEDISSATNSYEFCKLLDLEYIEFDFIMLGKEFGNNKEQMVSNIKELKSIYHDLIS